jgi:hypothetical protein
VNNIADFRDTVFEAIQGGMVACRILDGVVRNYYFGNPGMTAAWASASHVERAPKKKDKGTGSGSGGSGSGSGGSGSGDGNPPA